jgi:hypothetical protein
MDADYRRNLDRDGAPTKAFEPSLYVWATMMSRPAEDRAIVDARMVQGRDAQERIPLPDLRLFTIAVRSV